MNRASVSASHVRASARVSLVAFAAISAGIVGAGCSSGNEPVKLTPAEAAAARGSMSPSSGAATARPDASANPHAGAMGGGTGGAMSGAAAAGAPKSGGALQFTVPEGWIVQIPSSSMRKAQFQLPKEASDPEDAQLVLYYFGGEGGTTEANLQRWADQFVQPDGRSSHDVLVRSTRTVNGMNVTEASISGTFDAQMVPGQGESIRRENWSMLAAIVETPEGPYFAKLTGPKATVARWESSFREWVSGLHPTKN